MSNSGRPRPLYKRIADTFRSQIEDGVLRPGARLPAEAEIAREFNTTRSTAVAGLKVLRDEGLIHSEGPRGNFVNDRRPMIYQPQLEFRKRPLSPEMDSFITQMAQEGRVATQHIEVKVEKPSPGIRERLQLSEDELVVVRRRLRLIDGVPFNTNDSYFPYSLVSQSEIMDPSDIARGANVVLTELGHEQVRTLDVVAVRMPTPDEAERLAIGPGTPIAEYNVTGYTRNGTPVRAVINVLPGDRHLITLERSNSSLSDAPRIRPATSDDLGTVVELWEHAAAWLSRRGIDQWQYAPRRDRIMKNIAAGECWLVEDDGMPVATLTVDEYADEAFWTAEEIAEPALYVHRMVVRRDASGSELGSAMLDWASQMARRRKKQWLRLDAWRDNPDLQGYYSSRGFAHVRSVHVEGRRSGALFQRPAGFVRRVGPELLDSEDHDSSGESL